MIHRDTINYCDEAAGLNLLLRGLTMNGWETSLAFNSPVEVFVLDKTGHRKADESWRCFCEFEQNNLSMSSQLLRKVIDKVGTFGGIHYLGFWGYMFYYFTNHHYYDNMT